MKDRIRAIRRAKKLNQTDFGNSVAVSLSAVQKWESGENTPSDAVISLICRIYNVDEVWLRTGEGEMFRPMTREEEIAAFFGDVLSDRAPEVQRRLVTIMAKLPVEAWGFVEDLCQRVADEWTKKGPAEGQGQE